MISHSYPATHGSIIAHNFLKALRDGCKFSLHYHRILSGPLLTRIQNLYVVHAGVSIGLLISM